jgi:hypothetical protein
MKRHTDVTDYYKAERSKGWRASHAFQNAKTLLEADRLDADIGCDEYDEPGTVRLRIAWDDSGYDDSYLDTWTDIRDCERERIRAELWSRIERDGVVGVVGEYWNGDEWIDADSCWGFIGDDWRDSGYDTDILASAIDAYHENLNNRARALEATRPDMYAN